MTSEQTDSPRIPRHIAIIMDGNGRWAKERNLPRIKGHEEGSNSVRTILRSARKAGVEFLTLYAFSVENWIRPKQEVGGLMTLLKLYLRNEEKELHANQTRLRTIGRTEDLPVEVRKELERVMKATEHYTEAQLVLALSYGSRTEITSAVQKIAELVKNGALEPSEISDKTITDRLYAPDIPDPDLLIRTSGEKRISNFLLWQISYSELYFTPVMWPDFREEEFQKALTEYSRRQRRFGDIEAKGE